MKTANICFIATFLMISLSLQAQDIAVQTPANNTVIYHDLNLAFNNAPNGSSIFLPAGVLGLSDTVKIHKKLSIIGVGHRPDTEGGNTTIGGNIQFFAGSDGSSLMGCYVTGDVILANGEGPVTNFLIKYCNINSLQVGNPFCHTVLINQNFIRNSSSGGNSPIQLTNNILHSLANVTGGLIANNIIRHFLYGWLDNFRIHWSFWNINSTIIKNNILIDPQSILAGSNCIINNNMLTSQWGDNSVAVADWNEIFIKWDLGVTTLSNYHLKSNIGKNAGTDGTDIGIYGGTGFSDTALPPYPQIVFKNIPTQTDEFGNLKIQIKVKAQ